MEQTPYIKPSTTLPEITVKSVLLGALLSVILAGANAYLGLFAGMTVSASIPAAVISMAILKMFRNSNILENNCVQTAASAGESLAAGVIFTLPALILMGYWNEFNYTETTLIALAGGCLGVLFTIPLRSALIVKQKLKFPEGIATSEVLKSGEEGGKAVKYIAAAGLTGALFKLCASGFGLWRGVLDLAALVKGKGFLYFGLNVSPALMAVGYIVGLNIAVLVFIGGAISWWVAIPIYVAFNDVPQNLDAVSLGYSIWNSKIRYLGVGAMVVGGLWALISLRGALVYAIQQGLEAFKNRKKGGRVLRTDKDTPMPWVFAAAAGLIVPIFFIYLREIEIVGISLFMAVLMVVAGFLFSAVASYMAGLVGSSNNPISGVTIATILTSSFLLLFFLGSGSLKGPAAAILVGAVVCCAAAIGGDNMQDLKSGNILGATPIKQQVMQFVGVIAGALVLAPVLNLLNSAYGFGAKTAENPNALAAPQGTLMQSVAEGVFGGGLPWAFVFCGAIIGILVIIGDEILKAKKSNFRMPVLAVAVGIYLPFELDSTILLGGLLAYAVTQFQKRNAKKPAAKQEKAVGVSSRAGLLFASGLITGEALVGILLAIPVVLSGRPDVLALVESPIGTWPGLLLLGLICWWLINLAKKSFLTAK